VRDSGATPIDSRKPGAIEVAPEFAPRARHPIPGERDFRCNVRGERVEIEHRTERSHFLVDDLGKCSVAPDGVRSF
jgi:hypothetical protein